MNITDSTGTLNFAEVEQQWAGPVLRPFFDEGRIPFRSLADNPPALTGKRAEQQAGSLAALLAKQPTRDGVFLPVNGRANRRRSDQAFNRQKRRGQRRYAQRVMLEQRVINDLQHSFDVLDGRIATTESAYMRIMASVAAKKKMLVDENGVAEVDAEDALRQMAGR